MSLARKFILILFFFSASAHAISTDKIREDKGDIKSEIKSYIKSLDLTEQVKLIGKISGDTKLDLIKNCDLFVMPSYKVENSKEGFGISYIETDAI